MPGIALKGRAAIFGSPVRLARGICQAARQTAFLIFRTSLPVASLLEDGLFPDRHLADRRKPVFGAKKKSCRR
jgi:hypothetical protein